MADINNKGAEILIKIGNNVSSLKIPEEIVDELKELKKELKAQDILEALVKSSRGMLKALHSLDR